MIGLRTWSDHFTARRGCFHPQAPEASTAGTQLAAGDLVVPAPVGLGAVASARFVLAPPASSAAGAFCPRRRVDSLSSSSLDRTTSVMTSRNAPCVHRIEKVIIRGYVQRIRITTYLQRVVVTTEWFGGLAPPIGQWLIEYQPHNICHLFDRQN
jgi:hypothetical protein